MFESCLRNYKVEILQRVSTFLFPQYRLHPNGGSNGLFRVSGLFKAKMLGDNVGLNGVFALSLHKIGCTSAIEASFIAFGLRYLCKT